MGIRSFIRDSRGNVAVMFGLAAIPIFGLVGVGLDYNRAASVHQRLQQALDATSLALAREVGSLKKGELDERAMELFAANFPDHESYGIGKVEVVQGDGTLDLSAHGTVPTTVAAVLGVDTMDVGTTSQAVWGSGRIELALVLDNTGSMASSGKMRELKTAAEALLNTLEESVYEEESVRVSIVPFEVHVKVDMEYEEADWLRMPDESRGRDDDDRDRDRDHDRDHDRHGRNDDDDRNGRGGRDDDFEWNGCIQDRDRPFDVSDEAYDEDDERTRYPAVECEDEDLAEVMPLTDDFDALRDHVETMKPSGNTNIAIGVAWGMASLSPRAPLTEADPTPDEDLRQAMVVLTDGDNTENRWGMDRHAMDKRTKTACDNAKAAGILVYTVRVIDGNDDLLRDCASSAAFYYDVQNVGQLLPAFEGIAQSISKLRLAK